jgi:hypothetical protein
MMPSHVITGSPIVSVSGSNNPAISVAGVHRCISIVIAPAVIGWCVTTAIISRGIATVSVTRAISIGVGCDAANHSAGD